MDDDQLNQWVNSIGKTVFTEFVERCAGRKQTNSELAIEMHHKFGFTQKSCSSRISTIMRILKFGRAHEALKIVSDSRVDEEVR